MILKIENLGDDNDVVGYYYYEAVYLEYYVDFLETIKKDIGPDTNVVFILRDKYNDSKKSLVKRFSILENKDNNILNVITDRKSYILNENGKTIDVLH
jgi:hypothetical protein